MEVNCNTGSLSKTPKCRTSQNPICPWSFEFYYHFEIWYTEWKSYILCKILKRICTTDKFAVDKMDFTKFKFTRVLSHISNMAMTPSSVHTTFKRLFVAKIYWYCNKNVKKKITKTNNNHKRYRCSIEINGLKLYLVRVSWHLFL